VLRNPSLSQVPNVGCNFKNNIVKMDIKRFLIAIFLLTNIVSCKLTSDIQTLEAKIYSDTTLILKKNPNQGNIWGIDIKFSGDIQDSVVVTQVNGNIAYIHNLHGRVDTTYHSDWYSDSCLITFKFIASPINNLQIEYEFLDL
jgi:hypothetical protein